MSNKQLGQEIGLAYLRATGVNGNQHFLCDPSGHPVGAMDDAILPESIVLEETQELDSFGI